jgi:hypothetical protein
MIDEGEFQVCMLVVRQKSRSNWEKGFVYIGNPHTLVPGRPIASLKKSAHKRL